ncbi:nectin-4 [Neolamprologus brichardi]|uniref:nectin-4 n=1 Tax=Neolamprologus brichardi TaxID=32507 RepID=UPI001643F45F|nr:nectin-4 [Neolamprologus brichardi]
MSIETDHVRKFGRYSGRVRFENSNPIKNSALIILNTEQSDEGSYTCHISTFPSGNFEKKIALTVWSKTHHPFCFLLYNHNNSRGNTVFGRILCENRTSETGSVSSYFSLHPLRSMNGKKLDCLVWHPGLEEPRRISNHLEVQYPPDATITTSSSRWYVGLEKAELACEGRGHPKPQNFTWTWKGGALPDGVSVVGGKLLFQRPVHLSDSGAYECMVTNSVGRGKTEYMLNIDEMQWRIGETPPDNLLLIIICASTGGVILLLIIIILVVHRHHRRRTNKLKRQLSEKSDEIRSFSRQASFRRINSTSTDFRYQGEDSMLRIDSRMKNSQMSLEHTHSTLGGRWGPGDVELDELGRPVIWCEGSDIPGGVEVDGGKEAQRKRVESYVKSSSNMSLDSGLPSSLVPLKAQQDDSSGPREPDACQPREREDWAPTQSEGHDSDEDGSPYQLSQTLKNYFDYSNGAIRPKPSNNSIILHPRGQLI